MASYGFASQDEESPELRLLNMEVMNDPDSFEVWEKLVRAAEGLEGGLNRNSSAQSITSARSVYDRFLAKFPLFFGYWKKYADLEFSIAGTEAAELVYERGVASITNSVDLWAQYCAFKVETCHDPELIRELFERGADCVGLDFLSHPFWDRFLEYEERTESFDRMFAVLSRIVTIPMHQYARYFDKFRQLATSRAVHLLCPEDVLLKFTQEVEHESGHAARSGIELERLVRVKIDGYYNTLFNKIQADTTNRWTYEQEIKRPYFHVTELDDSQLVNWRKYLDFEETQGNTQRIAFLYERCLVATAYYDEFWLRYIRWMSVQSGDKVEEIRHIYQRAAFLYTPIARPETRLQYALFEEVNGRVDVSFAIYESMLMQMPGHIEIISAWANAARRHGGLDAAVAVFKAQIKDEEIDPETRASLIAELAKMLYRWNGSTEEARQVYISNQAAYSSVENFWVQYLTFESTQPDAKGEPAQFTRIKQIYDKLRQKSSLSQESLRKLSQTYMIHLLERGGGDAAKEFLTLDRNVYGTARPRISRVK